MLRLIFFIIVIAALSIATAWVGENEGTITIRWLGYEIQTTMMLILSALLAFIIVTILFVELILYLINIPNKYRRYLEQHRQKEVLKTLTTGFAALISHDQKAANKSAKHALKLLSNKEGSELADLLAASVAQMGGDEDKAQEHYSNLLENKTTKLVGLQGLIESQLQNKNTSKAIDLARQAVIVQPDNAQAAEKLLSLYKKSGKWADIQLLLNNYSRRKWNKIHGKDSEYDAEIALAIFMRALKAKEQNDLNAEELIKQAYKHNMEFIPAIMLMVSYAQEHDEISQAANVCKKAWEKIPHEQIAELYLSLYPQLNEEKRIKLIRKLIAKNKNHPLSYYILAREYFEQGDFTTAKEYTQKALVAGETKTLAGLMLKIIEKDYTSLPEEKDKWRDILRNTSYDPAWFCDKCLYIVGKSWQVECPNCHEIGYVTWSDSAKIHQAE